MTVLDTVGFEPVPEFPVLPYNAVHHRLEHFASSAQGEIWRQFAGAWNAVAYRFQGCAEFDIAFRADFVRLGVNTGGLDRHHQQRDTYSCIVNACSTIEAFYYAAHAIAALLQPAAFPVISPADQRAINPRTTLARFEASFAGDSIVDPLRDAVSDPAWSRLTDIRNVLVHRAAWAKQANRSVGAGSDPPVDRLRMSDYHVADVELGPDVTRGPRAWVAANLLLLCDAADAFVAERFR